MIFNNWTEYQYLERKRPVWLKSYLSFPSVNRLFLRYFPFFNIKNTPQNTWSMSRCTTREETKKWGGGAHFVLIIYVGIFIYFLFYIRGIPWIFWNWFPCFLSWWRDWPIVFIHAYLLNLNFSNLCVYVWTNNQDILINSYVFLLMNDHKHIKRSV